MAANPDDNARGILPGALLVGAVLAILGAGVVLSTDRRGRPLPAPAPRPPSPLPSPAPVPAQVPETPVEDEVEEEEGSLPDLGGRVAEDVRRLGHASGRFTAQILVGCKAETIERLVAASAGAPGLYVLPADVRGQSCYRVCWGAYATADEAAAAAGLPEALRGAERPRPVEIVSVLP